MHSASKSKSHISAPLINLVPVFENVAGLTRLKPKALVMAKQINSINVELLTQVLSFESYRHDSFPDVQLKS